MTHVKQHPHQRKHDTCAGRTRRTKIDGQFAPHLIDMLRSPAWCALSLSARRILDRVEIELANHGGVDNGKLPVTYDDFARYGIDRDAIATAIRECTALGFLEVTEAGRAGNAEWRKPNLFRLTYRETRHAGPTHEWKRTTNQDDAKIIARTARTARTAKTRSQSGKTAKPSRGNPDRKRQFHSPETPTTGHSRKTPTTLDISEGTAPAAHTADGPSTMSLLRRDPAKLH
jgi:hypothetical protein